MRETEEKRKIIEELGKNIYAHRGYHSKPTIPENSMAAFKRAVDRGWGIEMDLHLTKDDQLVICHDSSLLRTCSVSEEIEEKTYAELLEYDLEDSEEKIPLFKDFLKLVDGKVPLIIEIKSDHGRGIQVVQEATKLLEGYDGVFCVESFDPRVVLWLKKNRSDIVRGQLAMHYRKHGDTEIGRIFDFLGRNLAFDLVTSPDFIAYDYLDKNTWALRFARKIKKRSLAFWTITSKEQLRAAQDAGAMPIFERFNPEEE